MMPRRTHLDKLVVAADHKSSEENYWLTKFSSDFRKNSFPYDFKKTGLVKAKPDPVQFQLTGETFSRLMELIKESDVRLYIVLLSVLVLLLNKYTADKDITVGAPIYKQEMEVEFINTVLALKNRVEGHLTFKELLLKVGQVLLESVENQNYPIETLLYQLNIPFSPEDDFPLFDIAILLENIHDKKYIQHIRNNIIFSFFRTGDHVRGMVEYNSLRCEKATIKRIVSHFMNLLRQVLHNIEIKVSDIDILSEKEKKQLLFEYNNTAVKSPETTFHQLFEMQVGITPENIAAIHRDRKMTYKELNEKANKLALFLISKGVSVESIVGIMVERSIEMMVGILGVLKAGGAYLPISPDLPMARKKFMLKDSSAGHLLLQEHLFDSNKELAEYLLSGDIFFLDDPTVYLKDSHNPQVGVRPENPVYIIYTSGSTGQPKGVILEHRGIVNYVRWIAKSCLKKEKATFPLYTSFSFDLTVTSIFTPLITGNTILVYSGDEKEFLIKKVIEDNRVDIVKLTPSHLKLIQDIIREPSTSDQKNSITSAKIKRLIVGGEELSTQLAKDIHHHFNGDIKIYNEYGPTETVVGSMIYQFNPGTDTGESVPIGVPIDNTQIYLLDEDKKPVPNGITGGIFISGLGVGMGYLNRPELTAEKFMDNPFLPGKKMYATGDLGRRFLQTDGNGNMEFLGRRDEQVKIRGFRVELGEIENKIRNFNRTGKSNPPPGGPAHSHEQALQPLESRQVNRCTRCILPDNYPNIQFNEKGICHVCQEYDKKYKAHLDTYFKEPDDFYKLVETFKAKAPVSSQYDCLLLFSGGKDSSYVLFRLVDMGLKVLAFTFDNGFISEAAFGNIERITSMLNVGHMVSQSENMNQVFVESLKSNHNVCHGCWHALNTLAIKIAHEQGINLIISGLSRGQIYDMRLDGLFQAGIFSENEIEDKLQSFRKTFHSKDHKFSRLLHIDLDEKVFERIQFVDFFRYFNTPVHEIREYLSQKGWVRPQDTGFCSSNCKINDVGIYTFLKEEGYHFYAVPLSWDIRLGQMTREAGLAEITVEGDLRNARNILEEIGYYTASTVKDAVVIDKEDENGNKSLWAYIIPETEISLSESELREYLSRELPDYMIPSYFVQVDEIPLSASGKVDKNALLKSEGTRLQMSVTYVEPRDEKEKIIANLCKEVFNVDKIGVNDNFFNLGATSFTIIRLNSKLHEVFKKDIPVLVLFEYPTITSFLEYMDLEMPVPVDSWEEKDWVASKKEGQDKFKKLRNKRIRFEEMENG